MVSDSWEMAQILQGDAVICQDQHGTMMGMIRHDFINVSDQEPTWC